MKKGRKNETKIVCWWKYGDALIMYENKCEFKCLNRTDCVQLFSFLQGTHLGQNVVRLKKYEVEQSSIL